MDRMNRVFVAPAVAWAPIIGSGASFLVAISGLWAIIRIAHGDFPLIRRKEVVRIALAFAALFAVEAFCGLLTYNGRPTVGEIVDKLPFLLFLPIYSRLRLSKPEDIRRAVETAALASAFAALAIAICQVVDLGIRAEGAAGNSGPFAIGVLIAYAVNLLAAMRLKRWKKLFFSLAATAAAASVLLSGMRSLWPALILVPIIVAFVYKKHAGTKSIVWVLAAGTVIVAAFGFAVSGFIGERISIGMKDIAAIESDNYSGSLGERLIVWKLGAELFEKAPIFGQGPGHAAELLGEGTKAITGRNFHFSHYHNVFLNFAVRDGILGVLAILGLIFVPPLASMRHARTEIGAYGLAFLLSIEACYLLSGLFGIMFGHDIFDAVFIISMVVAVFLIFESKPTDGPAKSSEYQGSL
jgi:O-antigen ligase